MKQVILALSFVLHLTCISFGQSSSQTDKLVPKDFREIFQTALDLPELQQYYHINSKPTRSQVIIQHFGKANHDDLKGVTKFGKQVIILSEKEIKKKSISNYFVLGDWFCGTNSVRMQLSYVGEGLTASYMLKKVEDKWKIVSHNIIEE